MAAELADFYEVSLDAVKNYQRFRDEFELDGVKVVRGKDLKRLRHLVLNLLHSSGGYLHPCWCVENGIYSPRFTCSEGG
uniref:hypothetical protein n=1 Tax=Leptolyngbya sp. PCC 6402 TaxID=272136 RepID=UPI0015DFF653|nr:hypothetical protein [Leptolyngbya sp. PCC 6402]